LGAHDVRSTDRHPGVVRHAHAAHLQPVLRAIEDHVDGDHAVADDAAISVDVAQEQVEGRDALDQTGFQFTPLREREQARHAVDRDDPLLGLLIAVDREGDPSWEKERVTRSWIVSSSSRGALRRAS